MIARTIHPVIGVALVFILTLHRHFKTTNIVNK